MATKLRILLLGLVVVLLSCAGQSWGQETETGNLDSDHDEVSSDCARRLEQLKDLLESKDKAADGLREKLALAEEKQTQGRLELDRLAESVKKLEGERATCGESLERLQELLDKERSKRSGSVSQLEAALEELDFHRSAWLPFWASQRVEAARVVAVPVARRLNASGRLYFERSVKFLRHVASPTAARLKQQGWTGLKKTSSVVSEQLVKAWRNNVPPKYRKKMAKTVSKAQEAAQVAMPHAEQVAAAVQRQVVQTIDEIARLVEHSTAAPAWAKESSHVVAMFVLSFPILMIGLPLLSSLMGKKRKAIAGQRGRRAKKE